jgi:small-conductance mechanosensitive channel
MNYDQISESLLGSLNVLWGTLILFAPRVLTALVLIIFGYFISKFIAKIIKKILTKVELNKLGEKTGLAQLLVSMKLSPDLAHIVSKLCSIFIFFIFIMSAVDVLGMEALSTTLDNFILYIPNIIGALIVFFIASTAAHFAKQAVEKMGEALRIDFAGALGSVVYFAIMLIGVILAIGQLKIETDFLTHVIEILLVSAGVAMSISLGLGSRDVSKNIISGVYLKDSLTVGTNVKLGDFEGVLTAIKPVCFELIDKSGKTIVLPNSRLLDCEIIQG